jgi:hypothetical protein
MTLPIFSACRNRAPQAVAEANTFTSMSADMGLNPDQAAKLQNVQEQWNEMASRGHLSDPVNRAELAAQFRTVNMDRAKVQTMLNHGKPETSQLSMPLAESLSQFHNSLNIQQRELMATKIENGDLK